MRLAIYVALFGLSLAAQIEDQNGVNVPPLPNAPAKSRNKRHSWRCDSTQIHLTPSRLTPAQAQEAVSSQNFLRSLEPAADMLALSWSDDLAARAQAWVNQCRWWYGMYEACDEFDRVGQTILYANASAAGYPVLNMTHVAREWNSQRTCLNNATGMCNPDQDCGDFTQMVWSRSSKVGCGYANCPQLLGMDNRPRPNSNSVILVVCDYSPPGNVLDLNGIMLPVYLPGPVCSSCDRERTGAGYKCNNNFCEPCSPSSDATCRCGNPSQVCQNNGVWSNATCSCQCSREFYGTWCDLPCSCDDQMPTDCPDWKASGYCTNIDYRDLMLTYCPKTCNFTCKRPPSCSSNQRSN